MSVPRPSPSAVLAALVAVWLALALTVAVATPAFEATDEHDHIRNATTLAQGHGYRIGAGAGLESHRDRPRVRGAPDPAAAPPRSLVGMETTTMQGRLGFYGLGAIAVRADVIAVFNELLRDLERERLVLSVGQD